MCGFEFLFLLVGFYISRVVCNQLPVHFIVISERRFQTWGS
jgi:hypothetical protein